MRPLALPFIYPYIDDLTIADMDTPTDMEGFAAILQSHVWSRSDACQDSQRRGPMGHYMSWDPGCVLLRQQRLVNLPNPAAATEVVPDLLRAHAANEFGTESRKVAPKAFNIWHANNTIHPELAEACWRPCGEFIEMEPIESSCNGFIAR